MQPFQHETIRLYRPLGAVYWPDVRRRASVVPSHCRSTFRSAYTRYPGFSISRQPSSTSERRFSLALFPRNIYICPISCFSIYSDLCIHNTTLARTSLTDYHTAAPFPSPCADLQAIHPTSALKPLHMATAIDNMTGQFAKMMSKTGFLHLPLELRQMVYDKLVPKDRRLTVACPQSGPRHLPPVQRIMNLARTHRHRERALVLDHEQKNHAQGRHLTGSGLLET